MIADRPRHQVLAGDRDVTERCDSIVYSATDNGGFEIATLGLPSTDRPRKGAPIIIRSGLETAWAGRVAEISDHSQHGRATKTTGCEGLRALLRDTLYSMVYVDRELPQWGSPSLTRQIALAGLNRTLGQSQVASDRTSKTPALVQTITDTWASPTTPTNESWYDAGTGNLLAAIYYAFQSTGEDNTGTWVNEVFGSDDANATTLTHTANLLGGPASGYFYPTACRFAILQQLYTATPAGTGGAAYKSYWQSLAAYGPHGLPGRGADPVGYYPSDIARHALSQCSGIVVGQIQDSIGYIAPQVVYRSPTPADTIIDDMAKLVGFTWGVWDPPGALCSSPRLDFRARPTDATCCVSKAECDQLDITSRLGDLYNVCQVTYTDQAGVTQIATTTLANPQLSEAGIATHTLPLNMGPGSAASAQAFGQIALALSQISARAAGQATLPVSVSLPYGGSKPAHLLRPGLDRLRIIDLVDGGPLFDIGNTRRDVFRISRVETTVDKAGAASTRVELDSGTNPLETLQARMALAAGVVGSGASGG